MLPIIPASLYLRNSLLLPSPSFGPLRLLLLGLLALFLAPVATAAGVDVLVEALALHLGRVFGTILGTALGPRGPAPAPGGTTPGAGLSTGPAGLAGAPDNGANEAAERVTGLRDG